MAVTIGGEDTTYELENINKPGSALLFGGEEDSYLLWSVDATPVFVFDGEESSYPYWLIDTTPVFVFDGEESSYPYWLIDTTPVSQHQHFEQVRYVITSLSQAAQEFVINKVWDTVAGAPVRWFTEEIDNNGDYYPGPGAFGSQTSHYRVESVTFTRV